MSELPKTANQLNAPFVGQYEWREGMVERPTPPPPTLECCAMTNFSWHVWRADAKDGDACQCGKLKLTKI